MWTRVAREVFSLRMVIETVIRVGYSQEAQGSIQTGSSLSEGWRNKGPASGLETAWATPKCRAEEGMEEAGAGRMVV